MSKLIRINLGVDPDHNLADFPVNIYTGTTTGDTTNWGFTETPVITFPMVITTPFEFWVDDELLSFGIRLESGGCNNVDLLVNAPRVDCEMCMNVVPYNAPQPTSTPQPTQQPTATPIPSSTPNSTNSPTSTPNATPNPTPNATPNPTPNATPNPTVGTSSYYRIQTCNNALDIHVPKNVYCAGGSLSTLTNSFSIGETVQLIFANGGCGSATYCGVIVDENFQAPLNSENGYISRIVPVGGCEDDSHCVQ